MPDQPHRIRILIASPSDVAAERKAAVEVIRSWVAPNSDVVLVPIDWETHAAPESGGEPQEIINDQLVDFCDCAVGIFWTRIGTKTKVAPGGAVEELQRLEALGRKTMVYFSNAPVPIANKDFRQRRQVDAYREKREKASLCWSYENVDDFAKKLTRHLYRQIPRWFPELFASTQTFAKRDPDADSAAQKADEKYRHKLRIELDTVSLLGSSVIQPFPLRLKDIFVPLEMYDGSGGQRDMMCPVVGSEGGEAPSHWPEHVMRESFRRFSAMLVIGDPGSGKTTLMKYYALTCLDENPPRSLGFTESVRIFYLPLRELQCGDTLPVNLSAWSERNYLTIGKELFSAWLEGGASLVLFDGLDEVSDPAERKRVCRWIREMAGTFDKAKFVVTSRPAALRDGIALDLAHQRVSVRDFSPEQQESFLNNWYKAAYLHEIRPKNRTKKEWKAQQEGEARKLAEAIIEYLRKPENRGIRELAAIPMLLQIMAILWKERRFLPGRRQELYSAALDYLLDYRDRERNLEPLLSAGDARRVLAPVALWMQETLGNDEADRSAVQQKMQEKLDAIKPPHTVGEICRNLVDRAGVLVEQGKASYVFRHKTFREYLAGEQLRDEWFEAGRLKLLVRHFGEKSGWWDEVILFLMGQSNTRLFDQFMKLLFASPVSRDFSPKQKSLLARVIEESPEKKGDALCQALLRKGEKSAYRQRALLETLKVLALPKSLDALLTFRKAGLALDDDIHVLAEDVILLIGKAAGGEPSLLIKKQDVSVPLVTHPELIRNPYEFDAQYLLIPGGKYIYSQPEPKGTVLTVPNLWFAKYPVTNRQFRAFIAFLGGKSVENTKALSVKAYTQALHDLAHTGEDTLNGFDEYLKKESDLVKRFTSGRDEDRRFNKDDQPVTGVTFFDARAYCLWLSMLSDAEYRLPTEEEWEWAAGGRREEAGRVQKVKEYPWGDKPEPTPKHANYGENEGATTPVGRYPDGATPEGLYDMAGNVWEWTGSRYSEDTSAVSLRGGSWSFKSENLRCRARVIIDPGNHYYSLGFRVVCPSPILKI